MPIEVECMNCNKTIVKKPSAVLASNCCSRECCGKHKRRLMKKCPTCLQEFQPLSSKSQFCCRVCANKARYGSSYQKISSGNKSKDRLAILYKSFEFDSCMIESCSYNRCYHIHRLISGKDGGEYILGNMFAICPNHHQEIHSNLIKIEKVNDYTLKII